MCFAVFGTWLPSLSITFSKFVHVAAFLFTTEGYPTVWTRHIRLSARPPGVIGASPLWLVRTCCYARLGAGAHGHPGFHLSWVDTRELNCWVTCWVTLFNCRAAAQSRGNTFQSCGQHVRLSSPQPVLVVICPSEAVFLGVPQWRLLSLPGLPSRSLTPADLPDPDGEGCKWHIGPDGTVFLFGGASSCTFLPGFLAP